MIFKTASAKQFKCDKNTAIDQIADFITKSFNLDNVVLTKNRLANSIEDKSEDISIAQPIIQNVIDNMNEDEIGNDLKDEGQQIVDFINSELRQMQMNDSAVISIYPILIGAYDVHVSAMDFQDDEFWNQMDKFLHYVVDNGDYDGWMGINYKKLKISDGMSVTYDDDGIRVSTDYFDFVLNENEATIFVEPVSINADWRTKWMVPTTEMKQFYNKFVEQYTSGGLDKVQYMTTMLNNLQCSPKIVSVYIKDEIENVLAKDEIVTTAGLSMRKRTSNRIIKHLIKR